MAAESEFEGGLEITWTGGRYRKDIFPKDFFSKPVKKIDRVHGISMGKKTGKASCILTIKGSVAILEYPQGKNDHDSDIEDGELTVYFKDKSRKAVSRIDFLDSKGVYEEDVATSNWSEKGDVLEGRQRLAEISYFSRNAKMMRDKKAADNHCCEACGYRLEIKGNFIIDCHHKNPVAMGERNADMKNLLTLCPNCHRIAHASSGEPLTLDEIRSILENAGLPVAK